MKTKLLFEGWRKFVNEEQGGSDQECMDGCMNSALKLGKDMEQAEKDCKAECAENVNEAYGEEERATAGGMEQDIDMRQDRGDFEKGDYGNVGPGGGEMMDHGEYPWIKDALDNLKDEEAPDKEKALQALADELGVSITMSPELEDKED